jgi:hypothetical protein
VPHLPFRGNPRRLAAFLIPAIVLPYAALRGGSYDIVVRQEEGIALWWILALGFVVGLLPRVRLPRALMVPLAAVTLLALWTGISLAWTESDERTLAELARVVLYAGILVLAWVAVDGRTWRPTAAGIAAGAVLVTGLAAASRLVPDAFPQDEVSQALNSDRLNYPFDYWNAVGAWSVMSVAMALAWSAHADRLATRGAFLAVVPLCALAAYLTYSRAAALGLAVAVLLVVALGRNRLVTLAHAAGGAGASAIVIEVARSNPEIARGTGNAGAAEVTVAVAVGAAICVGAVALTWVARGDARWQLSRRAAIGLAAAGAAIVILIASTLAADRIGDAWEEFRTETPAATVRTNPDPAARLTTPGSNRSETWSSAIDAFESDPLKGTGPGTFELWWSREDGFPFYRNAHSLYLEQLAELGIVGATLMAILLASIAALALRLRSRLTEPRTIGAQVALTSAFLVYLLHAGVDWMWESTAVSVLALSSGALAAGGPRVAAHPRVWTRAALVAVAIAACLVQLPGLVSTSKIRDSQQSFAAGDSSGAAGAAEDAVDFQPWAATPYVQRALVAESSGDFDAAAADLQRAIDREPTNWRYKLLLARVEAEAGHPAKALSAYRNAKALRPEAPFFHRVPRSRAPR